jgi:protein ImuB
MSDCFACLYRPARRKEGPESGTGAGEDNDLVCLAGEFSPRYERHSADLISMDVGGLERLLGTPRTIGDELRREAALRGLSIHVALAATRTAAVMLACGRPGLTVVEPGREAAALAPLSVHVLAHASGVLNPPARTIRPGTSRGEGLGEAPALVETVERWGVRTLGELAALPAGEVAARLGREGVWWQAIARGDEVRPLVPTLPDERFEGTLELEWPIEGREPLSFVLTRLLEPLSTRLERRDRGAAALSVTLRLVTRDVHTRRLELPAPIRDVRTLRTLALIDLESHPPAAAIDAVTVVVEPTPGRVLQHALFTRAHPTPERVSTLLARLGALMGQDRIGAPAVVDTFRPGAFAMKAFLGDGVSSGTEWEWGSATREGESLRSSPSNSVSSADERGWGPASSKERLSPSRGSLGLPRDPSVISALRRWRQPVPARVAVAADGRPVHVTTDRHGIASGAVIACAGPWRTSGAWWLPERDAAAKASPDQYWNRDEWETALADGAVYRIFRNRDHDAWFVEAVVD